mmetsp:Transcript_36128/g.59325  ORF Transcript_36128/g.59325 Transcript_36128/m.59325 type:complete len:215 (+) Transcript_36128:240-884(+)
MQQKLGRRITQWSAAIHVLGASVWQRKREIRHQDMRAMRNIQIGGRQIWEIKIILVQIMQTADDLRHNDSDRGNGQIAKQLQTVGQTAIRRTIVSRITRDIGLATLQLRDHVRIDECLHTIHHADRRLILRMRFIHHLQQEGCTRLNGMRAHNRHFTKRRYILVVHEYLHVDVVVVVEIVSVVVVVVGTRQWIIQQFFHAITVDTRGHHTLHNR